MKKLLIGLLALGSFSSYANDYDIKCYDTIGMGSEFSVEVRNNNVKRLVVPNSSMQDYEFFNKINLKVNERKISLDIKAECAFEAGSCPRVIAKVKATNGHDDFDGSIEIRHRDTILGMRVGRVKSSSASCEIKNL